MDRDLIIELWRALIAANIRRQGGIEIVVASAGDIVRPFDLARRHFGGATKLSRRNGCARCAEQSDRPEAHRRGAALADRRRRRHVVADAVREPVSRPRASSAHCRFRGADEPEAAIVAPGVGLEEAGGDKTFGLAFDPHYRAARALNEAQLTGREAARVRETVLIEIDGFVSARRWAYWPCHARGPRRLPRRRRLCAHLASVRVVVRSAPRCERLPRTAPTSDPDRPETPTGAP